MAKWTLPDMISRAEADRQTQEAVAAAIRGLRGYLGNLTYDAARIDDYITSGADAALAKMLVEARAKGLEEAATLVPDKKWWQGGEVAVGLDRLEHVILARAAEVREKNDE